MVKALLLSLLLVFCQPVSAIGAEYIVMDTQLTQLETKLIQLKSINSQLQYQLDQLHKQSANQENSLTNLSMEFDKFAASQHRKIRGLKFQRNFLLVGVIGSLIIKK